MSKAGLSSEIVNAEETNLPALYVRAIEDETAANRLSAQNWGLEPTALGQALVRIILEPRHYRFSAD